MPIWSLDAIVGGVLVDKQRKKMGKAPTVLAFIDFETTGHIPLRRVRAGDRFLCELWNEIIDIGAVFVDPATLLPVGEDFSVLVKPEHPERCIPDIINHYPKRAAKGEWDNAVSLEEGIRGLLKRCRQCGNTTVPAPGGQNFTFDWNFLSSALAFLGIEEEELNKHLSYKRFETGAMGMQELWDPRTPLDLSDYSLRSGKFQAALGLPPEPMPHRAINGAYQSYYVFKALTERKMVRISAS